MKTYPEHEKQRKILNEAQAIGRFIDWLHEQGMCIGEYDHNDILYRKSCSINEILAAHFGIDLNRINEEKEDMLNEFRKINNKQS